ncbi:hypothetical protein SEA_WHACK_71 [Rhodococcus phage Whack]|uniref:Uncharacterized protein n=1 Tax=Rhodococcus phage Whack TaxID=2591132 RepID=A0A515MKI4_9CAUD|nr:hypothetical protein HWC40_gp71 [Rhodococcus phage Whack]QDM57134.1 hypothetical protein SEA_WHACK_71 [Rhodococcus phage Whack]
MNKIDAMDIVEFLRARLDEDEQVANTAIARLAENDPFTQEWRFGARMGGFGGLINRAGTRTAISPTPESSHINRHGPARILREVAAKRLVIEAAIEATSLDMLLDSERRVGIRDENAEPLVGDIILEALASAYSDHPDYRKD